MAIKISRSVRSKTYNSKILLMFTLYTHSTNSLVVNYIHSCQCERATNEVRIVLILITSVQIDFNGQ